MKKRADATGVDRPGAGAVDVAALAALERDALVALSWVQHETGAITDVDGILVGILSFLLAFFIDMQSNIMVTGLFSGLLMFIYFVALEVSQGASLGKKILGLSVRGAGGAPKPDFKQSAIRNSFTLLPIIPYVGGLLAFIAYVVIAVTINGSPTKQGKHDELAGGTQVVKS